MTEWTATKEDIERWLTELGEEASGRDYDERYKFGFTMALVAVMRKMDDARRGSSVAGQPPS